MVAVHLHALPTGERSHHALHAGGDGRRISGTVDVTQLSFGRAVVPLIAAPGAAVSQKVLGRGNDVRGVQKLRRPDRPLQTHHHLRGVVAHDFGIFGVALVGAAPPIVPHDSERGAERPVEAGGTDLDGRDLPDPSDELRVACRPEPDVMGEDCCPDYVVVPVDRVRPPDRRDRMLAMRGVDRGVIEPVCRGQPLTCRSEIVVAWTGVTAVQDRAEGIVAQFIRGDAVDVGLNDLADLLLDGHVRKQRVDASVECRIRWNRPGHARPELRMRRPRNISRVRTVCREQEQCAHRERGTPESNDDRFFHDFIGRGVPPRPALV